MSPRPAWGSPPKLSDCDRHGADSGAELVIVEGDSAAEACLQARDRAWQALLPMQGKPMNTVAASRNKVAKNVQFSALIDTIGAGFGDEFDLDACRYERIVLLLDPDADGIHSRALLLLFFYKWMRPLLEQGAVFTARPPLWEITSSRLPEPLHVFTDKQYDDVIAQLEAKGVANPGVERYRGVASIPADKLTTICFDPETRALSPLGVEHAEGALRSFERMKNTAARRPNE